MLLNYKQVKQQLRCGGILLSEAIKELNINPTVYGNTKLLTPDQYNSVKNFIAAKRPVPRARPANTGTATATAVQLQLPLRVQLSRSDSYYAELRAQNAYRLLKESKDKLNYKESSRITFLDRFTVGFKAEAAFARLFDLPMPSVAPMWSDGRVDFWVNNISVDIKASTFFGADPLLVFDSAENFGSDIACLMQTTDEDMDVFTFNGWISRKDFLAQAATRNFGQGNRLYVSSSNLQPIERLWRFFKENQNETQYQNTRIFSASDLR
jgi:hypothetical protein